MRTRTITVVETFPEWLLRALDEGRVEPDWVNADQVHSRHIQIGRRVLVDVEASALRVMRFASEGDATEWMADNLMPEEGDAFIGDDRHGYSVSVEGSFVGTFPTFRRAGAALRLWMRKNGVYPTVWVVNERGNSRLADRRCQ